MEYAGWAIGGLLAGLGLAAGVRFVLARFRNGDWYLPDEPIMWQVLIVSGVAAFLLYLLAVVVSR